LYQVTGTNRDEIQTMNASLDAPFGGLDPDVNADRHIPLHMHASTVSLDEPATHHKASARTTATSDDSPTIGNRLTAAARADLERAPSHFESVIRRAFDDLLPFGNPTTERVRAFAMAG
jgi:hypothetical protein